MSRLASILGCLASFGASRRAAAAVEFALILPLALIIYIGAAEVGDGIMTSRKVALVTRTLTDLTSQQGTSNQATSTPTPSNAVTAATLSTMLTAAATLLAPKSTNSLTMTISAIDLTNNSSGVCCVAKVRWSYTQGGALRPCNVNLTPGSDPTNPNQIPSQFMPVSQVGLPLPSSIALLVADVAYTYQPLLGQTLLTFAPPMQRSQFMFPRSPGQVVTGALPASGAQYGLVCY